MSEFPFGQPCPLNPSHQGHILGLIPVCRSPSGLGAASPEHYPPHQESPQPEAPGVPARRTIRDIGSSCNNWRKRSLDRSIRIIQQDKEQYGKQQKEHSWLYHSKTRTSLHRWSRTNRMQVMEERISGNEDTIKEVDLSVKENVKFRNSYYKTSTKLGTPWEDQAPT